MSICLRNISISNTIFQRQVFVFSLVISDKHTFSNATFNYSISSYVTEEIIPAVESACIEENVFSYGVSIKQNQAL